MAEDVTVRINADTQPFQDALQNLESCRRVSARNCPAR